ncbi:ABC transporter substrate-binding protein [Nostoc sp. FACHB-190]|uniref:ABC transporter substrate-binding protein n=1 Tax=Nostoc sp. FACHB-190 TaxID=2692838 RepID=UPI0016837F3D|nr:extracellular solute-binding protein [Nostoc sp. FACHB-190]MBD2299400.1 extracellular solute-binding protein [Nostoc sp. FACHB-190]
MHLSFRQHLRAGWKFLKYLTILLTALWFSISLPGCSLFPANVSPNASTQSTKTTAPVQRFDGITVNVVTRSGVIGAGLKRRIPEFESLTGAKVNLTMHDFGKVYDMLQADWSSASPKYDMAVAMPQWLIDFVNADYLEDLTARVEADAALQWEDIAPFFRNANAIHNQRIYGVPVDGDYHLLYYRTDLLSKAGLTPPLTWDDYLKVAQNFHGKDLNGDGTPDYGSCIAKEPGHVGFFMFSSIATSYLQSKGTGQGAFFDAATMKPQVKNEAFAKALDVYKQTMTYGVPDDANLQFVEARNVFLAGRCALMIDWGDIPTLALDSTVSKVTNKVGAAMTPGSSKVLDQTTGKFTVCDKFICPYAIDGINHAPFAANLGYTGVISAKAAPKVKDAAYAFLSYMSQPAQANVDVTIGATGFNPYRVSQFKDVAPWIQSGMSEEAANNYLGAIGITLSNPNMALDLKLPHAKRYQLEVLDPALKDFMAGKISREQTMGRVEQGWEKITDQVGRESQKTAYRYSLGLES